MLVSEVAMAESAQRRATIIGLGIDTLIYSVLVYFSG